MIRGITFAEQVFYSADFAHYMNFFLNGGVGITKGCNITQDGTKVTIGTGYFVAHGRLMNVESEEVVEATQGFESGYNRIVYEIDLSRENSITEFRQGAIRVLHTEELVQEDLDAAGSVYQFPLCHFQWSGTAITDFVIDAPTLVLDDIFKQWSDNYTAINAEFDAWFADRKAEFGVYAAEKKGELQAAVDEAEKMISDLKEQGFENKSIFSTGTMAAAGWVDGAYSFEAEFPSSEYNIFIQPDGDRITADQVEALGAAMLTGSLASNVYVAKGDVPVVDIPIIIRKVVK